MTQFLVYFWFRFCFCRHRNWSRRNRSLWQGYGRKNFTENWNSEYWESSRFCYSVNTITAFQVWYSDFLSSEMIKTDDDSYWLTSFHFHGTGHCFRCPFHQRESHQDLLLQPSLALHCLPAKSLGNQTLFGLKLSIFKLFQMKKYRIFCKVIALLSLASKPLLQMARGSPLLTATWDYLLVAEVAGSWYYNPFLHFLLSPLTLRNGENFRSKLAPSLFNLMF